MDSDIRSLERASRADPSNEQKRDALERAWLKAGLGWHGEALPRLEGGAPLLTGSERGVYRATLSHQDGVGYVETQFVYVPGGEVECDATRCKDNLRADRLNGYSMRRNVCRACQDSGKKIIKPFFIGRFPVTWREDFVQRALGRDASFAHHPVTHVSLRVAKEYCSWAGLRLPTSEEWRWAALGGIEQDVLYQGASCAICKSPLVKTGQRVPGVNAYVTAMCPTHGESQSAHLVERRIYPWGNEPPASERCVWAGHPGFGRRDFQAVSGNWQGSTAPVVEWLCPSKSGEGYVKPKPGLCVAESLEYPAHSHTARCRLVPARPSGASWCGAQDMAGNVWEWVELDRSMRPASLALGGHAMGGSFRVGDPSEAVQRGGAFAGGMGHDDVGFRVALSAGDDP